MDTKFKVSHKKGFWFNNSFIEANVRPGFSGYARIRIDVGDGVTLKVDKRVTMVTPHHVDSSGFVKPTTWGFPVVMDLSRRTWDGFYLNNTHFTLLDVGTANCHFTITDAQETDQIVRSETMDRLRQEYITNRSKKGEWQTCSTNKEKIIKSAESTTPDNNVQEQLDSNQDNDSSSAFNDNATNSLEVE